MWSSFVNLKYTLPFVLHPILCEREKKLRCDALICCKYFSEYGSMNRM